MTLKVTDNQYTVGYPSDSWASCSNSQCIYMHIRSAHVPQHIISNFQSVLSHVTVGSL